MKRKFLFFVLVILLCFGFTSCESVLEMMAVKTIHGYVYLWLPSDDVVELSRYSEGYGCDVALPNEIVSQERKKELQEEYPEMSIFKEKEGLELHKFLLNINFGESRKDFSVDLTLISDEKKYFGKIEIPYLMDEGGIAKFKLLNEEKEQIEGILIYNFWMSI